MAKHCAQAAVRLCLNAMVASSRSATGDAKMFACRANEPRVSERNEKLKTDETLLSVANLEFSYGKRKAVDGVSFTIAPGQVFGLLGPNGAGKTSTISCICGLLSGWNGELTFGGSEFRPASEMSDRAKLGLVPQELAIYPNLTAEENLKFFAKIYNLHSAERAERIANVLDIAGLSERKTDLVRTYSGGMQRRLNLAVGLLHHPQLVVLDEPTVGVDPQSRNHLFESLVGLKASGQSLLYTTHYMEEAQRLCDTIGIMNEGKLVATGTPTELAEQVGDSSADLEQVFLELTGRKLRDD